MKVAVSTIFAFLLLATTGYAFFDGLKDVVDKGSMEMNDMKDGKFESIFLCPPFKTRQESRDIWKSQVKDFCKEDFTIHQESYESNPQGSNAIYAIVSCGISEIVADTPPETTPGEQDVASGDEVEAASGHASVISLKPEKTKKVLYKKQADFVSDEDEPESQVEDVETSVEIAVTDAPPPAPVISSVNSAEINEYITNLNSTDPEIMREYARKMFYNNLRDQRLFDAAEQILMSNYRVDKGKIHADGLGWLCKVLGGSGQIRYKEFLDKIASSGATFKLRWHAAIQRDKLAKSQPTNKGQ